MRNSASPEKTETPTFRDPQSSSLVASMSRILEPSDDAITSTGFFDLPLELRQQAYRDYLPRNEFGEWFGELGGETDALTSLCKSDERIACEAREEERVCIRELVFRVTATEWQAPAPINYPNLVVLQIEFGLYPFESPLHSAQCGCDEDREIRQRRDRALAIMYRNLQRFVAWFKEENGQQLSIVSVEFENGDDEREPCWLDPLTAADGREIGFALATREASPGKTVTIVESLLMPLKSFPVVNCAVLRFPRGSRTSYEPHTAGSSPMNEPHYGTVLKLTWMQWLKGKRDRPWRRLLEENLSRNEPN